MVRAPGGSLPTLGHIQFKHPTKPGRTTVPHPERDIPIGTRRSSEAAQTLRVREKEEQITSMQRQIEDFKRKAQQGSRQLQGEVRELALEANSQKIRTGLWRNATGLWIFTRAKLGY
jgi:Uncharacterized protein conserved in bacteria (DUF2130)/HicA toxin of bacterial toxin-antitoxin,